MYSKKVVARIKGGLGNQLFCYAAARRLAAVNDAELILDSVTGFSRDTLYRNEFQLGAFSIPARIATKSERLEPFERYRRGLWKIRSRMQRFEQRKYIEQGGLDFDPRLLNIRIKNTVYLDGLWQSEKYFDDIRNVIVNDLRIQPPRDADNLATAKEIRETESVAIHVRWFDSPGQTSQYNSAADYYRRAIRWTEDRVKSPRYFIFSDNPDAAVQLLGIPASSASSVTCNQAKNRSVFDLWLMAQCRTIITANSTFSWWGAWLAEGTSHFTVTPRMSVRGKTAWGFSGLVPDRWVQL
jgi:hypothetical protein